MAIPLGWVLSDAARKEMDKQVTQMSCTAFDNPENLNKIDRLLKARYQK
jgi:hypothetical protein